MPKSYPKTVILGGGIHGSSVAYYLAKRGIPSLLVEQTGIASAASGKAGGFLARNWGSGPTVPLHQLSFDLYASLAGELKLESYRKIPTVSVDGNRSQKSKESLCSWIDNAATSPMDTG
jgi:glycine/D-amino acid oxidase-like deaminating enzyme